MIKKILPKRHQLKNTRGGRPNQSRPMFLSVVVSLSFVLVAMAIWPKSANPPALAQAHTLKKSCPEAQSGNMECQMRHYQKLYEQEGVQGAFVDLREEYAANPSVKSNCHQLTHVIGKAAALKYNDVAAAYENGDEFCWSGYYHGVMEGLLKKLGNGKVVDKLNTICESVKGKDSYSFDHYNCAHGLGHGIMLIEADELFVSLETCDKLNDNWERESCYGGVFMENIMAHLNPDHSTKYVKNDDPLYPCTAVKTQYATQCYGMQTSHSLQVLGGDYGKVFSLCAGIDAVNQPTCYQSLGRDASGSTISDPAQTHALCMQGPTAIAKEGCMVGAVKDFISYHHSDVQATELCASFEEPLSSTCNQTKTIYYQNF